MTSSAAKTRAGARSFLVDTVFVFAAQTLSKLRGLVMMPLLIRGLGVDAFGTWTQLLAFTVLVCAITGLNLHHSLIRFIAAAPEDAAAAYATTLSTIVVASGVLCGALALVPSSVAALLVGSADLTVLWLSLVVVMTSVVRNLNLNLYRATGRLRTRSLVDFLGTTAELGALIVVASAGFGFNALVWTLVATGVFLAVATTIHGQAIVGLATPKRELLRKALAYGLPSLPAALSMWILDRSDRFVISHFLDQVEVGRYAAHYTIGSLILFVLAPLQVTLVPKVMQLWDRERPIALRYVEVTYRIFIGAALLIVAMAGAAPGVLALIANPIVSAGSAVDVLLISSGLAFWGLCVIETCILYSGNRTKVIGAVTFVCAMTNASLCVLLVPRVGILGAAIATLVSYLVCWVGLAWFSHRVAPTQRYLGFCIRTLVAATVVAAGLFVWKPTGPLQLGAAALAGTVVYIALLFLLRAVTPSEWRWLRERGQAASTRLRQRAK